MNTLNINSFTTFFLSPKQIVDEEVGGNADPFTGGSGYRPDYKAPKSTSSKVGGAADPFTGSGAYRPETGPNAPRYLPGDAPMQSSEVGFNLDRTILYLKI